MPNGFQKPVATLRSFLPSARAPEDVAAVALAGDRDAVGADQLVRAAEIFAHAEDEIALGIEAKPGQAVVRIIALGVEKDDAFLDVGLADRPWCRCRRRISLRVAR